MTAPAHSAVLSDGGILGSIQRGLLEIDPFDPELVQPASVDIRLGNTFRVFNNHRVSALDLREPPPADLTEPIEVADGEVFVIHPGEFCLASSQERIGLPDDLVARIEGKSSLGRLGLIVHATAGFCDPGWRGILTLELNNLSRIPIKLHPGQQIAQLSFLMLDAPAKRPYGHEELGSRYQDQAGATESRYESANGDRLLRRAA